MAEGEWDDGTTNVVRRPLTEAVESAMARLHGSYQRCVDDVFGDEPDLQFVASDDVVHAQVIGSVVAGLDGQLSHRARFLEHDLVRVQQPRERISVASPSPRRCRVSDCS